jgi:hypothetical protein
MYNISDTQNFTFTKSWRREYTIQAENYFKPESLKTNATKYILKKNLVQKSTMVMEPGPLQIMG